MSLDIGKHRWYDYHNQGNRRIQYLPSFLMSLWALVCLFCSLFLLWRECTVSGVVGRHSLAAVQLDSQLWSWQSCILSGLLEDNKWRDWGLLGHSSPVWYSTNGILPSGAFHLIGQECFRTSLKSENLLSNPPFFLFSSHSYKTWILVWRLCLPFPATHISSLSN